jgi:hypothetical protein
MRSVRSRIGAHGPVSAEVMSSFSVRPILFLSQSIDSRSCSLCSRVPGRGENAQAPVSRTRAYYHDGREHREQTFMTAVSDNLNWERTWNIAGTEWEPSSHRFFYISIPNASRAALGSAPSLRSGGTGQRGSCQTVSAGPEVLAGTFPEPRKSTDSGDLPPIDRSLLPTDRLHNAQSAHPMPSSLGPRYRATRHRRHQT